jgi:hypothetical protein
MRLLRLAAACACLTAAGCSLGQGEGSVKSRSFYAPNCWGTADGSRPEYDLRPDFFAANSDQDTVDPTLQTMLIRVQRSNDLTEYSDGLEIELRDVPKLREDAQRGVAQVVAVPTGVGAEAGRPPPPAETNLLNGPSNVSMSLYLLKSCHNQGTVLNAVSGTITFTHLFSGDPDEQTGSEKLTEATFAVQVGDLQEAPVGAPADAVPIANQSHLTGSFRFYFERGQPAQPFP